MSVTGKGNACDFENFVHERPFVISAWTHDTANVSTSFADGYPMKVSASVEVTECPSFAAQAAELPPPKELGMHFRQGPPPTAVRIGLFKITDSAGFFDLQSSAGRREAAKWIRETLAAIRPCWKTWDADTGPDLLKHVYSDLSMSPPYGPH